MKVFRGTSEIIDVNIDDKTQLKQVLQGMDVVQVNFVLENYFEFKIGDHTTWQNKKYTILEQPSIKKIKSNQYQYNFEFKADFYKLAEILFLHNGDAEFFLFGNAQKFINHVITNIGRITGVNYTVGSIPTTKSKNLSFKNENCLQVIQKVAKEFNLEYFFLNNQINLTQKIGTPTNLTFEFKKGLRNIERKKVSDANLVTRLYAFGGTKNITKEYGKKRLGISALEKNTSIFGIIEGTFTDESIYPHRTGTVSAITSDNVLKFKDTSLDFDVNSHLMDGLEAKVTFNTGRLAGNEFVITSYNHSTKEFEIKVNEESNGFVLPNDTLKVEVGDTYVLHNIKMPQIYFTNAENELQQKAQEYLDKNSLPNVIYEIILDYPYLRKYGRKLHIGDVITIKDTDFGITLSTRILEVNQSLSNEYLYRIKVGKKTTVGYLQRLLDGQLGIKEEATAKNREFELEKNYTKRRFRDAQETIAILQEAQLDFGKSINPITINTMGVLVGNQASQFVFVASKANPTEIEHNFSYNKTTKKLTISAGAIKHIADTDILKPTNARAYKFWSVNSYESAVLEVATKSYYLYIKANKTNENAIFTLSENPIKLEEVTGYYHLLVGILNSEFEKERSFVKLYGFSEYLPSQLKINRLTGQNLDINLLTGEIKGDVTFTSSSPALAQTKAISETAKQQAISTSSADATSKANIAKSQAEAKARELVDAVEIGGRNLLSNFVRERSFLRFYIIPVKSILENHIGKDIVVSFEIKCSVSRAVRVYAYQTNGISIAHRKYFTVSEINKYQRFTFITKAQQLNQNPDYSSGHLAFYDEAGNQNISIRKVFVGLGNKFGGYAKSEEDIANERDEKIAQAKTESQTAWETYANLKSSNAQQSAIDTAKAFALAKDNEKETIIKSYADGKITTAEQNAINVATAKSNLAETNAKAWADGKITAEEQARILADTQKLAQAEAKARELVDAVEIGGRNLLLNSNIFGVFETKKTINLVEPLIVGKTYTLSFIAKKERTINGWISIQQPNNWEAQNLNVRVYISSSEFQKYKATFVAKESVNQKLWIYSSGNYAINLREKSLKLEKGTRATDWSPAPEDVDAEILAAKQQAVAEANAKINTSKNEVAQKLGYSNFADFQNKASAGKTIIKGGIINTQLINAVAVISKYLQTELLVANKIISSNSGISVNINANNNIPFEVFNSLGTKQLELKEENGSIQFIYRNKAGHVVWHMGEEGVKYNQSTPASWKSKKLKFLGTAKSFANSNFGITGRLASLSEGNAIIGNDTYWVVEKSTNGSYFYEYVSGTSAATITHPNQHGVTYKSQNYADSNKIANGYYYLAESSYVFAAGENNDGSPLVNSGDMLNSSVKTYDKWYCITVFKYTNGKITEQFQYIF